MCVGVCGVFGGEPEPGGAAGAGSSLHTDGTLQLHTKVSSLDQKHYFLNVKGTFSVCAKRKIKLNLGLLQCCISESGSTGSTCLVRGLHPDQSPDRGPSIMQK